MLKREELLRSPEYWFEIIQNELYRKLDEYLKEEGLSQTEFAQKLGVSKGYIFQVMNGNFNYTLKKLIEISLAINKIPDLEFVSVEEAISEDKRKIEMVYSKYTPIENKGTNLPISTSNTTFLVFESYKNVNEKEIAA